MAIIAELLRLMLTSIIIQTFLPTASASSCFQVRAAINFEKKVFFIDGNDYIAVDYQLNEVGHGTLSEKFAGYDGQPDAAFNDPRTDELYFFQGGHYRSFDPYGSWLTPSYENKIWGPFYEQGISAITKVGNKRLVFNKKCQYMFGDVGGIPKVNSELGLGCHVSAAWSEGLYVFILTRDKLWVFSTNLEHLSDMALTGVARISSAPLCRRGDYTP